MAWRSRPRTIRIRTKHVVISMIDGAREITVRTTRMLTATERPERCSPAGAELDLGSALPAASSIWSGLSDAAGAAEVKLSIVGRTGATVGVDAGSSSTGGPTCAAAEPASRIAISAAMTRRRLIARRLLALDA